MTLVNRTIVTCQSSSSSNRDRSTKWKCRRFFVRQSEFVTAGVKLAGSRFTRAANGTRPHGTAWNKNGISAGEVTPPCPPPPPQERLEAPINFTIRTYTRDSCVRSPFSFFSRGTSSHRDAASVVERRRAS